MTKKKYVSGNLDFSKLWFWQAVHTTGFIEYLVEKLIRSSNQLSRNSYQAIGIGLWKWFDKSMSTYSPGS